MHYSRISTAPAQSYSAASAVLVNEVLKGTVSLLTAIKRIDNQMTAEQNHLRSPTVGSRAGGLRSDGEKSDLARYSGSTATSGPGLDFSSRRTTESLPMLKFCSAFIKKDRWKRLSSEIFSPDCWKLSIPAILYVIQNNLQYTAASNLDVATFQVTYQMKILTTAFFSVLMLGKRLTTSRWLALLLLAMGVGIVQIQSGAAGSASAPKHSVIEAVVAASEDAGEKRTEAEIISSAMAAASVHQMSPYRGFLAVCAACVTSGLAGVYFEMVLKNSKADLWIRNVQLSLFSLVPALLPILFGGSSTGGSGAGLASIILEPFRNFNLWAWGTVLTQVFGGLITALVIKYSDNILKGFATSLSIILSFVASVFLFNYRVTPAFVMGSSIVLSATFMYNQPAGGKPNPIISALVCKISEFTGGKVDANEHFNNKSRTDVAVPGSPIPANAPIIGETPKPSRTSSMVSLLGLSRAPTPSQSSFNGRYTTSSSKPNTPFLTAHGTPVDMTIPLPSPGLNGSNGFPSPRLSRPSSTISLRDVEVNGTGAKGSPGVMTPLQTSTPPGSATLTASQRKTLGRLPRDRPVLELRTDISEKMR